MRARLALSNAPVERVERRGARPALQVFLERGAVGAARHCGHLDLLREAGDDPAVLVHDPRNRNLAHLLVEMPGDVFPVALGVIYDDPAPTFESAVLAQNAAVAAGKKPDLQALVAQGQTWQVEKEPHTL